MDLLGEDERERYKRQMLHDGFGEEEQARLRSATVLLAGVGGLGGAIAYGLAAAGVGRIKIVHQGGLTESNLNRQTLMSERALGESRARTAAARIGELSRFARTEAYDAPVTEDSLRPLLNDIHLIIDARHNFPERRTLNKVAVEHDIPLLYASMDGLSAQMALFRPKITGCFACLYPGDPPDWDPFGFAVFGAVAHAIGAVAAMEAIKYLSGWGEPADRLIEMDLRDYSARRFTLRPVPQCPVCGQKRQATMGPTAAPSLSPAF